MKSTGWQDPLNQNNYVVMIRKRILPVTVPELSIKGVIATLGLMPQPQYKPENTLYGDTGIESRWSSQGMGQWIQYELTESRSIRYLGLATAKATERSMIFNVETSEDSVNWTKVYEGQTSGATLGLEAYGLTPTTTRFLRIVCFGNNNGTDWNSITEVKMFGQ